MTVTNVTDAKSIDEVFEYLDLITKKHLSNQVSLDAYLAGVSNAMYMIGEILKEKIPC